jgi:hypothetical protein
MFRQAGEPLSRCLEAEGSVAGMLSQKAHREPASPLVPGSIRVGGTQKHFPATRATIAVLPPRPITDLTHHCCPDH